MVTFWNNQDQPLVQVLLNVPQSRAAFGKSVLFLSLPDAKDKSGRKAKVAKANILLSSGLIKNERNFD